MMKRTLSLAALALLLSACAGLPKPTASANRVPIKAVPQAAVRHSLQLNQSSKEQVRALLGDSRVLAFESGYEVWVYRDVDHQSANKGSEAWVDRLIGRNTDSGGDLILLFAPSGVLTKVRYGPSIDK